MLRRYVAGRLLWSMLVLLGVLTIVFAVMEVIPGDFIDTVVGQSAFITDDEIESLKAQLGLDRSVVYRYGKYVMGFLTFDLGYSYQLDRSVTSLIAEQWPSTAVLALSAILLFVPIGLAWGLLPFVVRYRWVAGLHAIFTASASAAPSFWLGLMLVLIFSLSLGWFPSSGQGTIAHIVLPAVTLGFRPAGLVARLLESSLRETLVHPYITTARAKGLREFVVLLTHAFRNAVYPLITVIGVESARLLAGTTVVETIFARPGVGRLFVEAIFHRDLPAAAGAAVVMALVCTLINLVADIAGAMLDPRVRYG